MIDANKAYKILQKKYPGTKIRGDCLDFGKFFVMNMVPIDIPDNEPYYTGTVFDAVDKLTGRAFEYDLTNDVDAMLNAKKIHVETYMDKILT